MLKGKKILIGVTGSIAAYKIATLIRLLVKDGAEVKVIMTASAAQFISPLTLSTLAKSEVMIDLNNEISWANHVMLGRWADIFLIAPLSCNTLAKMATGQCDNLLLAVYLSATCPVAVAPAMDEDMWKHPTTKRSLDLLKSYNNEIIPVAHGELASGLIGEGRMAEPEDIFEWLSSKLKTQEKLKGKKVLITAGPTYEALDPVRFIGNHSSGKMGIALAETCLQQGAEVTLVLGPVNITPPEGVKVERVISAAKMLDTCLKYFDQANLVIMSAAVADYTPVEVAEQKIKKSDNGLEIALKKTTDILAELGKRKKNQTLVGFALETENERENALGKLKRKNADYIVLNSLNDSGAGFQKDTNKVTLFDKNGKEWNLDTQPKTVIAKELIKIILDNES